MKTFEPRNRGMGQMPGADARGRCQGQMLGADAGLDVGLGVVGLGLVSLGVVVALDVFWG